VDYILYFDGAFLEAFSATDSRGALRFVKGRYGSDAAGVIAQVGIGTEAMKEAAERSRTVKKLEMALTP
jgi:hypothetical protein